jgi:hypothetical protein
VQEFVRTAEEMASHRPSSEKAIDDAFRRLAEQHRQEIWESVKGELDRLVQQESSRPHPVGSKPLTADYLSEKLDPKHRAGFLLRRALQQYFQRKPPLPFFEWLESLPELEQINLLRQEIDPAAANQIMRREGIQGLAARGGLTMMPSEVKMFVRGVAYLDDAARASYRLEIHGGLLVKDGREFDTHSMQTVFSGHGWAIYVQSPQTAHFYSGSHVKGLFHHSSFLSGAPVLGAGEWRVSAGLPLLITAKSGHYQPQMHHFVAVLTSLRDQGVNLAAAKVRLYQGKQAVEIPILRFLSDPQAQANLSTWG